MSQPSKTPFAVATGLSLLSSSYFIFGNVGMVTCGVIRFITSPKYRKDLDINADRAVASWAAMYEAGAANYAPTSLVSAIAFFAASVTVKSSGRLASKAHHELISRLFLTSSLVSLAIVPYTLLVMLPNIKPLIATRNRILAERNQRGDVTVLAGDEPAQAIKRIQVWQVQNLGRMAIGFTAWTLGAVATFLA